MLSPAREMNILSVLVQISWKAGIELFLYSAISNEN